MLQGGVWNGSTTMLLGAAGSGKTLLGLHFLAAGAARGEPCLHFGFHESPATLVTKAERVGLPFGDLVARGALRISWQLPVEKLLDRLAEELLAAVEEHGATRLFLDGLNSFRHMTAVPQRPVGFFTALTAELRSRGVTTFLTVESASLFGTEINQPFEGISALVENILLLRYVEYRSSVRRMAGILKLRDSDYDHGLRELLITPQGMRLGGAFVGIESILSGIGRTVS
jgi:circadian clock protein KaiC